MQAFRIKEKPIIYFPKMELKIFQFLLEDVHGIMNGKYTLQNLQSMIKDTNKFMTVRLPEQIDLKY
jgi:hypothetical protein